MAPHVHVPAWPGFLAPPERPLGGGERWGGQRLSLQRVSAGAPSWDTLGTGVRGRNSPREQAGGYCSSQQPAVLLVFDPWKMSSCRPRDVCRIRVFGTSQSLPEAPAPGARRSRSPAAAEVAGARVPETGSVGACSAGRPSLLPVRPFPVPASCSSWMKRTLFSGSERLRGSARTSGPP